MRISAEQTDPGNALYCAVPRLVKVGVLLNGATVRDCVTVDTKRGLITAIDRDEKGSVRLTSRGDRIRLKQLSGCVELTFARYAR